MSKYSPYILYLVIALLMSVLAINDFGPVAGLQRSLDDLLCRITAPDGIRPNVVLVDIDDRSIEEYGKWPWDQDLIADLTAAVAAGEPKAILLDIELYEDAAQEAAGRTDVLAGQLSWISQAVLPYDIAEANFRSNKTSNPEYLFTNSVAVDNPLGLMDEQSSMVARKVFLPAEKLLQHKPLLGFDYQRPDDDRLLRHQPLVMNYEGYYYPSASLIVAATYLGVAPSQIKVIEGQEIQLGANRRIPINNRSEFFVRFSEGTPFAQYSASQVLSEEFSRETLKNKAVVVGLLNGNEAEYFATATESKTPEMLVKATVIENIINNNFITPRTDLAKACLIALLVFGAAGAFVLPRISLMYRMIVLGGALIILANADYLLFASYGMMVPIVYIALELVLFMAASPLLDTAFLGMARTEVKKPSAKVAPAKTTVKPDTEAVPLREIKATANDPENVATMAIGTMDDKSTPVTGFDHQTLTLDEPAQPDATVSRSRPTHTSPTEDSGSTAHLSDSDAAAAAELERDAESEISDSPVEAVEASGRQLAPAEIKKLGRYQILGVLGKGAMGTVYRGVDPAINRPVAMKTIRLDFVTDPEEMAELKERLHREAQAAGKLSHPNIVTIYDVGSEGNLQYIAMEYLEGQTLEEMIKKKTRFNYKIIAQMITQICQALQYAHDQGIVHRDIKPANIMVLSDYRVKVMDFGIARVDSNSMTKTGVAMGTPNYISPEQLKGREIDRRADIFSLGVMMYEMLLGKRPFKGENLTSLMYAILNQEPEKPTSVRPQIPLLYDHIITKALKKDPAERYQKASDIVVDLHDFVESFVH
jgi:CHASE2 domain-containing sensor protein/predicted Ser/Thr protein kinase